MHFKWDEYRFRVKVENVLGEIKRFRIMQQRYRNNRIKFNTKFGVIAGLVNLKNGFGFAERKRSKTRDGGAHAPACTSAYATGLIISHHA
jgi:hypothetical protein